MTINYDSLNMSVDRAIEALAYEREQGNALREQVREIRHLLRSIVNSPDILKLPSGYSPQTDDLLTRINSVLNK